MSIVRIPKTVQLEAIKQYMGELAECKYTTEDIDWLSKRSSEGCIESRKMLVDANLKIVVKMAMTHSSDVHEIADLIQEGNIGLMRAIRTYDYSKGFKFVSYATPWIKKYMFEYIHSNNTMKLTRHVRESINRYEETKNTLQCELNRIPSVREIANSMHVQEEKVHMYTRLQEGTVVSDTTDEDNVSLIDYVNDKNDKGLLNEIVDKERLETIDRVLKNVLDDREILIIKLRFGFIDGLCHTLQTIGDYYGVSRERIRQLEKGAIKKLQKSHHVDCLYEYIK